MLRIAVEGGIATLHLDAPSASVNKVSPAFIEEMTSAFEAFGKDEHVSGIVITSARRGFMAGADLEYILAEAVHMSPAEAVAFSERASRMHRLIETCGKPVVVALNGFALGGGYELALACHRRILADDRNALVGLPEVTVGLLPGSGGTQRLPRLIGVEPAIDMLMNGRTYGPEKALALKLVDEVVPPDQLIQSARNWLAGSPEAVQPWDRKGFTIPEADGLLKQSTAAIFTRATGQALARHGMNYPAPISILTCIFEGVQVPFEAGLRIESRHFARLLTHKTSRNLIRTTFVNKGLAEKGARRPRNVAATRVNRVGILGAGMMGAGIAFVSAKAGIETVLIDRSDEIAASGKAYSEKRLSKLAARELIDEDEAEAILARITATTNYDQLKDAELVIEAVFEDKAVKAEVTGRAAQVMPETAFFASNTSTLPISQLAEAYPRQEDFIGLHFFSPVDRMSLVEVIRGEKTSDATLARALDYVARLRKIPIVVNDRRGFYTSRVFQTFIHEGMEMLREGVAPALIENAARQAGMPVGPLAVLDEVTLDLPMHIVGQSEAEDPAYRRPASMEVLERMTETCGRHGRKSGGGFYEYSDDGTKRLWPGLSEHFPVAENQPDVEDVKKRLLYIQALETARCLDEGVLTHPADGDLGAVFGWGFPGWTGGTLSLIETVGVEDFVSECDRLAKLHGERFVPTGQVREMARSGQGFAY